MMRQAIWLPALLALGQAMTADPEATEDEPRKPIAAAETAEHIQDDEENTGIDAGYTYLGQFIDHDIMETIADFIESAKSKNISVELKNITLLS